VQPLFSPAGSVGLMQINGKVWRGIYDPAGLEGDIGYNGRAGAEILHHYLRDFAVARGEHLEPGGSDNLAQATYAAYNGGPGHLARYRKDKTSAHLQEIDREFWRKYQAVQAGDEAAMLTCFPTAR
jgi:soluble lytic murein transglycosylase-like protein